MPKLFALDYINFSSVWHSLLIKLLHDFICINIKIHNKLNIIEFHVLLQGNAKIKKKFEAMHII